MPSCKIHPYEKGTRIVAFGEMQPGQFGEIIAGDPYVGHIVMRTQCAEHHEIMDLSDFRPNSCWGNARCFQQQRVKLLNHPITVTFSNEESEDAN